MLFVGKVKKQSTRSVNSLQIDVSDTARFFGGELSLVRMVVWVLAARGIHARAAIADTPAASWVAALCVDRLAAKNQQASSDFCKKISRSARGSTCLEKEKPRSFTSWSLVESPAAVGSCAFRSAASNSWFDADYVTAVTS